jgi:hypothetical protein
MPTGPGGLDSNGIWQFGEDDSEALASDLLNLGMGSVSDALGAFGGSGILQVVSTTNTTPVTSSSGSFVTSNSTATITPSSASSDILVIANASVACFYDRRATLTIFRGTVASGTNIGNGANGLTTVRPFAGFGDYATSSAVLDSPSTTSAITYTLAFSGTGGAGSPPYTVTLQNQNAPTTFILMEVAG